MIRLGNLLVGPLSDHWHHATFTLVLSLRLCLLIVPPVSTFVQPLQFMPEHKKKAPDASNMMGAYLILGFRLNNFLLCFDASTRQM